MGTFRVRTPVADYTGMVGGVAFTNGEATVEGNLVYVDGVPVLDGDTSPAEFHHMVKTGYIIEAVMPARPAEVVAAEPVDVEPDEDDLRPADVDGDGVIDNLPKRSASTEAWRAFAVEHGMPEAEAEGLTRDQLVELYASKENQQ